MRFMSIPPFEQKIEILDFDFFIRSRLNQAIVIWPEQAIALVGYMGWPNDREGRATSAAVMRAWPEGSRATPPRLRQIQTDWARVAGGPRLKPACVSPSPGTCRRGAAKRPLNPDTPDDTRAKGPCGGRSPVH
jgi:hypothetical protein